MDNYIAEELSFERTPNTFEADFASLRCNKIRTDWKAYDPTWLAQLAREQLPHLGWLPSAFERCTRCRPESKTYIHFVDNSRPNQPGAEWQFELNLMLNSQEYGTIVVDILTGQRVGGIEFLNSL